MTDAKREKREELRRRLRAYVEEKRKRHVQPDPPPRYDEVYFEGTAWLDRMARGEVED